MFDDDDNDDNVDDDDDDDDDDSIASAGAGGDSAKHFMRVLATSVGKLCTIVNTFLLELGIITQAASAGKLCTFLPQYTCTRCSIQWNLVLNTFFKQAASFVPLLLMHVSSFVLQTHRWLLPLGKCRLLQKTSVIIASTIYLVHDYLQQVQHLEELCTC